MNWYVITGIACVACLGSVWGAFESKPTPTQMQRAIAIKHWLATPIADHQMPEQLPSSLEPLARSITVKVMASQNSGSGVLIQRQGQNYSVLTNHHVLNAGAPYRIQTANGQIYPAKLLAGKHFGREDFFRGKDLEILQFASSQTYAIASLNPAATLTEGDAVFAAGFPHDTDATVSKPFVLTSGRISLVLQQAFVGGYRIGYTNLIQQGMSGGPLLNRQGEVIGVNGLHAYPLWGNPYTFEDGSRPRPALQTAIARSSWAIPIVTFICLSPLTQMSLVSPVKREELCSSSSPSGSI